jgi:hypothetical protein
MVLAQDLTEQAPVTAWPERLGLTVAVLLVTVVAVVAMWRNWRRRAQRQQWVELPPLPGKSFTAEEEFLARYVASVTTEDWLDRIAAKGLGVPGRAEVKVGADGVLIRREGALDLFLPAQDIVEVTSAKGIAQEVYERDGIVAITWRSGGRLVTTGLRMSHSADHVAMVRAVTDLIGKAEV